LLDSSTITLTMSLYEWAHYTTRKGAVKMHTLLDYDSLLPEFVNITDGKCGDNRGALDIPVPPHSVVVADCGYCDFSLLDYWDSRNVFFCYQAQGQPVLLTNRRTFIARNEGAKCTHRRDY